MLEGERLLSRKRLRILLLFQHVKVRTEEWRVMVERRRKREDWEDGREG